MSDKKAICAECGHVRSWHHRDAARAMRSGELASDRSCYREIGGAGCRCSGFRDSGEVAVTVALGRLQGGRSMLTAGGLVLLLVVMGVALLYAYRSQTPATPTVTYSQAVQEISSGQVARVTVTGTKATLDLRTGERQQMTVPERPELFQKLLDDYNQQESATFALIGSIFLSLLPVLLLGAFFLYLSSRVRAR